MMVIKTIAGFCPNDIRPHNKIPISPVTFKDMPKNYIFCLSKTVQFLQIY